MLPWYLNPISLIRTLAFALLLDGTATCINLLQYPSLIFIPFSRHLYRLYNKFTAQIFASLLVVLAYLFAPAELVLSGDHKGLEKDAFLVVVGNHQTLADWWWLWILAWRRGASGDVKIILKESLKWVPVIGWGMSFLEFIFLARKWAIDKARLHKILHRAQRDALPLWLLLFPEGTVITHETLQTSLSYGRKQSWPDKPRNVLIPKHTGLFFVLRSMQPHVQKLYDITIGFEGVDSSEGEPKYAYDVHTLPSVFFAGKAPKRIHMHVREFVVSELPGFAAGGKGGSESTDESGREVDEDAVEERSELFGRWLRQRWMEKDGMMDEFYGSGSFQKVYKGQKSSDLVEVIKPIPGVWDWGIVVGCWVAAYLFVVGVVRLCS
ncbi:hypothetical protein HK097_007073 [Rhizophlyctis rosea]|uniref:Phospholipid/glycerol acyltransferase domain-containing protein n=1 Tax=Rhizophlyctis rosea TaxID=64517 RepID=A0AAD5X661_9FUNG|nr:hypothetical protein HK097_007073 [Rhizophlyctis rosea]